MKLVLIVAGSLLCLLTVLSRVRSAQWWVRVADFPRLQVAVGLAAVLVAFAFFASRSSPFDYGFVACLAASLAYQCKRVLPYTPLGRREVHRAEGCARDQSLRLMISNVLMENRQSGKLIDLVRREDPDLLLVVETDGWWREQLATLDRDFPHSVKRPQENYYGMMLFSKLELPSTEIRFLIEDDVPSIRATVRLRSGDLIDFHGVHPRPPEPQVDTEERDAELLVVGREVKGCTLPAIVAGDLNDVAWSHTTRLFRRISGTLDPRRGRGMFSTFHAKYPVFRWPLDHIFHDRRFTLIRLERLSSIGSDHFPVLIELCHEPDAEAKQVPPRADAEDRAEATERISDGKEAAAEARDPHPRAGLGGLAGSPFPATP